MKKIDDTELSAQIDRLADLAVKATGRKKADLLKAIEEQAKVDSIIDEIETAADEADTATREAMKEAIQQGEKKILPILKKQLERIGYTDKIDKIDKALGDKLVELLEKKDEAEDRTPEKTKQELSALKDEIKALKADKETLIEEHETKLEEAKADSQKVAIKSEVKFMTRQLLAESKAVLPKDKDQADRKLNRVIRDLEGEQWEKDEKGEFYAVDDKGTRLRENGKVVKLSDRFNNILPDFYTIRDADDKDDDGLPGDKGGGRRAGETGTFQFDKYKGAVPKNEGEYLERANDYNMPIEQRAELSKWFETEKPFEKAA